MTAGAADDGVVPAPPSVARAGASPVLDALAVQTSDPVQHTQLIVASLRDSGPAEPAWAPLGVNTLRAGMLELEGEGVRFAPPECFAAGCMVQLTCPRMRLGWIPPRS